MRILITGGAGFIGSHLADELLRRGHTVRALDNLSPQVHGAAAGRPAYLDPGVELLRGDVRDADAVRRALRQIDAVYHFAAAVGVGQSMYEIDHYTSVNNHGTATLLQALIEQPVQRLVVASSMSLYGEGLYRAPDGTACPGTERPLDQLKAADWEVRNEAGETLVPIPTPEDKPPSLSSVYALSKFDQERLCLLIGRAYNIPTVALRFFNVFGTRQSLSNPYTGVLAIFASRLMNGRAPLIFEDGLQRRDFVSVQDIAQACVLALDTPAAAGRALKVLEAGRDFAAKKRHSVYNIQRLYLDFLEALNMREDTLPGDVTRGELVFYQLGKFSQVISDYEQVHFTTEPKAKYEGFAKWLEHQAPDYYADADADVGYATPDAVTIATVHQAKGLQWPAVFLPAMRKNRFPSRVMGGVTLRHVIPDEAIDDPARYRGTVEDETRLLYVAVTRAQKYLYATFAPLAENQQQRARSVFFDHIASQQWVSTISVPIKAERLAPQAAHETPQVTLSFSELKHLFQCLYEFKLRFLYGFNAPIHEALGYGKGLHDALSEIHKRALEGDIVTKTSAAALIDRHLNAPFAYTALREQLRNAGIKAIERYLDTHGKEIANTEFSEKQIQVHVAPGITVDGRIDLIRRLDTGEVAIVDFKSSDRAQAEEVTRDQLHVYAVGYQELTGKSADLIEVLNLDEKGKTTREPVDDPLLTSVRHKIRDAGEALRTNKLPRLPTWNEHVCGSCDLVGLCREQPMR